MLGSILLKFESFLKYLEMKFDLNLIINDGFIFFLVLLIKFDFVYFVLL